MENFPALTINPSQPIEEGGEDNVIRSPMEAGYVKTRVRFTRSRRNWKPTYESATEQDKEDIAGFYETVGHGAEAFTWTHPTTEEAVTVRFKGRPRYINTVLTYWNIEIEFEEV